MKTILFCKLLQMINTVVFWWEGGVTCILPILNAAVWLFDVETLWRRRIKVNTLFPTVNSGRLPSLSSVTLVVTDDHPDDPPPPGSTSFLAYLRTSVGRRAWAVPQKWGCSCESLSRLLRCTATPPSEQTSPGRTLARTEHTAPCRDRVENTTQHNFICWRKTQDLRRLYRLILVSHFGSTPQLPVVENCGSCDTPGNVSTYCRSVFLEFILYTNWK